MTILAHYSYAQECNAVSIYFGPGKYSLTKEDVIKIKHVISVASSYKIAKIIVEGHSDTTGSQKSNTILSQRRIDATVLALKPLLNSYTQIQTINNGELNPVSLTDLTLNRCTNITIILDTLINLGKQGEAELWLNTKKLLGEGKSCDFTMKVTGFNYKQWGDVYPAIPLSDRGKAYNVYIFNRCFSVYVLPDSFYNPVTHIGVFDPPLDLLHCSPDQDSLNFSYNADKILYDSISKSYYLIVDCHLPGGVCCAGAIPPCESIVFVPEQTMTHVTTFSYVRYHRADTVVVRDELVWRDWKCTTNFDESPNVYSIAMFDSTYYYLKGDIEQYKRTDTSSFLYLGEKYTRQYGQAIFQLKQEDYTSFTAPTGNYFVVKIKKGYVPGYYLNEYKKLIPFENIRKRKYKCYVIDFPTSIGLQKEDKVLLDKEVNIKKKTKKSGTYMKISPR
ncbi:MAG: OmpA family protein [Cytophagaceae bacterium]